MKIIVIGLFLIILFGCKQASVQFMGEIEKQWKSDSVEVVLCGARRGERLFVAPIREDGTFLLSGNISSNKLVFINFPKDYMRIPVWRRIITFLLSRRISITHFRRSHRYRINMWNFRKNWMC